MQVEETETPPAKPRRKDKPTSRAYVTSQPDFGHPKGRQTMETQLLVNAMFGAIREVREDAKQGDNAATLNAFRNPRVADALAMVLGELAYSWRFIPREFREKALRIKNTGEPLTFGLGSESVLLAYRDSPLGPDSSESVRNEYDRDNDDENLDGEQDQ